nr:WG repeat-containing protein [Paenibacillus psychroresistens]
MPNTSYVRTILRHACFSSRFLLIFVCIAALFFVTSSYAVSADSTIKVKINNVLQSYSQPPVLLNEKTVVPMRAIFEALGAQLIWNDKDKSVIATRGTLSIYLKIGDNKAKVNDEDIILDQPAALINGNTMVPVRFVGEAMGATVTWEQATKTVIITYKTETPDSDLTLRFPIIKDQLFGFIDITGTIVITPQFSDVLPFTEGLAAVEIDGLWGYIDITGKIVIPPGYGLAYEFSEGLANVENFDNDEYKSGFIDKSGKIVIPLQFNNALDFSEGITPVEYKDSSQYINKNGEVIIKQKFFKATDFSEGVAAVAESIMDPASYIDKEGRKVFNETYGIGSSTFIGGFAAVQVGEKWGFIDHTGKLIIQPQFSWTGQFSEGLVSVYTDDKWGFMNSSGEMAIAPKYEFASDFSEGLAMIQMDRKRGYINNKGEIVIEPEFVIAFDFKNGLALVENNEHEQAYINQKGEFIYPFSK